MRNYIVIIIGFFGFVLANAQTSINNSFSVPIKYESVEVKPEFTGGINNFFKYIGENFKLPEVESLNGVVKVSYVIDIDGKLKDIKILQDLGDGTGEEALRILKSCPLWTPGEQDGVKVKVIMQLPINLKI